MNKDILDVMGSFSETALDCIENQYNEIRQLQNNWNELKEWLIQIQKIKGINQQGFSWGIAQEVLNKMQEIEERK